MIFSYAIFLVLFLGGMWMVGIAHQLPDYQSLVFVGGVLAFSAALAYVMRASGSATRRSNDPVDGTLRAPDGR